MIMRTLLFLLTFVICPIVAVAADSNMFSFKGPLHLPDIEKGYDSLAIYMWYQDINTNDHNLLVITNNVEGHKATYYDFSTPYDYTKRESLFNLKLKKELSPTHDWKEVIDALRTE